MEKEKAEQQDQKKGWLPWIKRLGVAGFLFFLIKGLIWLMIFMGLGTWLKSC